MWKSRSLTCLYLINRGASCCFTDMRCCSGFRFGRWAGAEPSSENRSGVAQYSEQAFCVNLTSHLFLRAVFHKVGGKICYIKLHVNKQHLQWTAHPTLCQESSNLNINHLVYHFGQEFLKHRAVAQSIVRVPTNVLLSSIVDKQNAIDSRGKSVKENSIAEVRSD